MRLLTAILTASLGSLVGAPALADRPGFGDTFTFGIGGLANVADAKISLTREGAGEGTTLDLDDLGVDDEYTTLWIGAGWQFADRWRLGASYSKFTSNGDLTAQRDGTFGDVDFSVGAMLESDFDTKLYIVDLTWDFFKTENVNIGVGLGLHVLDLGVAMSATIETAVNGQTQIVDLGTDAAEVTAPLPNVTLTAGWMLGEHVYLTATGGYFTLDYDQYGGDLVSARASAEWRPFENFGVGAGYQLVDMDLTIDKSSSEKEYEIELSGPVLFLTFGF